MRERPYFPLIIYILTKGDTDVEERIIDLKECRKKTDPKITKSEIVKMIAKQSGLTRDQVRECFSTYVRIIESFARMDNVPETLKIEFPDLGYFHMTQKAGAKKGDVFNMPTLRRNENGDMVSKKTQYVIEEDRPDYQEMKFKVYKSTAKSIRELSEERWRKQNEVE